MTVPSLLSEIKTEFATITKEDPRKEQFIKAIHTIAQTILKQVPSRKEEALSKAFLEANFTQSQVEILQENQLTKQVCRLIAIENYMEEKFPANELGCCRLLIMKEGEILFSCTSGKATPDSVPTFEMPQHFGSVSKQFTAASVIDLALRHGLSLDTNIRELLPNLPYFTYQGEEVSITIDHLLQMRSGLPECIHLAFLRGLHDQDLTTEAKMAPLYRASTIELSFLPGTQFHYCNTNYYLLSELVETVSGNTLQEYASQAIFTPLNMNKTRFLNNSIPGYSEHGEVVTTRNQTVGPCGVVGSPEDMVIWDNEAPKQPYYKFLTEKPKDGIYARGLHVQEIGPHTVIFHPGGIEGFQAMYLKIETNGEAEVSFFLAATRDGHEIDHWTYEIANMFLEAPLFEPQEMPPPPPEPSLSHCPIQGELYEGTYRSEFLDVTHEIVIEDTHLKMKPVHATEQFSFLLFQDKDTPEKFIAQNGAEILFTTHGFTFQDRFALICPIEFKKVIE